MVQKVIDVVGVSPESFTKAATDAVEEAAKSVRNMKWARVSEMEMGLEGGRIVEFRTTLRIYFDVESP
ncbi:MAG: dodecin domain-containing protein [Candidatus Thermoplasmatota archaeon]|nr:dodecin domain-containing protein [Candidatus Thermoplasmatota archaeon]